jgi:transposase
MLVESLVKETVELQGFRVATVTGGASGLVVMIAPDGRFSPRCGQCLEPAPYRDTRPMRGFRHVPMWGIPVELRYAPRRVSCPRCEGVHVEAMPWVSGKQRMTRALMLTLAIWTRVLPWKQVARLFRCAWGTVASAVEEAVAYGLANRDLEGLTHIGIDEISRKRGHVYVTNVYDLRSKRLVWSGEGRSKETLAAFFAFLGPEKTAALQGICCDMWQPYIDTIKAQAPQAVLVFDKFHIVRHLMEAVDEVRRDEIREKGPAHKALMYKTRFIWLKNPWNLTEGQAFRLGELERLNLKINRAYLLKELFRHFWDYTYAGWAKKYLKRWFWWATHSRLAPIRDFAWLVRRHEHDILNYSPRES